jgi:hypothetical protein
VALTNQVWTRKKQQLATEEKILSKQVWTRFENLKFEKN